MIKRIIAASGLVILSILLIALPVFAITISNPDTIAFGSGTGAGILPYRVFSNVLETGDFMFTAEGVVYYSVTQNYTASQAFLFEILDTTNTSVLFATPITSYGDRPISIYITASQAVTANITSGTAYWMKITGNPLVFTSPVGNTVSVQLSTGDYFDESIFGTNPSSRGYFDPLRLWCLNTATNMQSYDSVTTYLTYVQGYNYLTTTGGNLFISGMPNLNNMCPLLFQASIQQLSAPAPTSTGAYASSLTPLGQMGSTIANGLNALGRWTGIGGDNGGAAVLLVASIIVCAYLYKRTESGIVVLLLGIATPIAGVYLGLMPMALMFIFVLIIVIIMLYYFFSRGIL